MARKAFFSFHFHNDAWRAGQVRNSGITQEVAGFLDAASWEEVMRKGDAAIKRWIDSQLLGTSVTVVLIGSQTASRTYVEYEIKKSIEKGNGLLGIYVDNVKDQYSRTSSRGRNPLDNHSVMHNGQFKKASSVYKTYIWSPQKGYNKLGDWIEEAARMARR